MGGNTSYEKLCNDKAELKSMHDYNTNDMYVDIWRYAENFHKNRPV